MNNPIDKKYLPFKVGQVVMTREFGILKTDDLERHKILQITTLGDGTIIVTHRAAGVLGYLLPIVKDTELQEFISNTEITE